MSTNFVKSRIDDILENILKQVMEELSTSPFPFSLQLDEALIFLTAVSWCCYVNGNEIKEEFLLCEPLLKTAKAIDVFQKVNNFFVKQNFDWKKKIDSIWTDGALAMTNSGLRL